MPGEKPFDAADKETHPAFAVRKYKPPSRQPAPTPALNRFAGDVEAFGHIVDAEHRLRQLTGMHVECFAHLLDQ